MNLLSPLTLGDFHLSNRIVMAPMTRARSDAQGVQSPLAVEYYGSRASAGLLITEGTGPSAMGMGYARTPGIFTVPQIAGWRSVTDEAHARGGRIFLQIMHVGRIAHSAICLRYCNPAICSSSTTPKCSTRGSVRSRRPVV